MAGFPPVPTRNEWLEMLRRTKSGGVPEKPFGRPMGQVKGFVAHDTSGDRGKLSDFGNVPANYHFMYGPEGIRYMRSVDKKAPHAADFNASTLGIARRGWEGDRITDPREQSNLNLLDKGLRFRYGDKPWLRHPELGPAGTRSGGKDKSEAAWLADVRRAPGRPPNIDVAPVSTFDDPAYYRGPPGIGRSDAIHDDPTGVVGYGEGPGFSAGPDPRLTMNDPTGAPAIPGMSPMLPEDQYPNIRRPQLPAQLPQRGQMPGQMQGQSPATPRRGSMFSPMFMASLEAFANASAGKPIGNSMSRAASAEQSREDAMLRQQMAVSRRQAERIRNAPMEKLNMEYRQAQLNKLRGLGGVDPMDAANLRYRKLQADALQRKLSAPPGAGDPVKRGLSPVPFVDKEGNVVMVQPTSRGDAQRMSAFERYDDGRPYSRILLPVIPRYATNFGACDRTARACAGMSGTETRFSIRRHRQAAKDL